MIPFILPYECNNYNFTCSWKGSSVKGYVFAGSPDGLVNGLNSWPGGTATSWVHESTVSNVCTVIRGADSTSLKWVSESSYDDFYLLSYVLCGVINFLCLFIW